MIREDIFRELTQIAETHDLLELSVNTPEGKFKIRRPGKPTEETKEPVTAEPEAEAPKAVRVREGLVKVTSPLMGIFYRAPAPGVDPFVNVGENVQIGDTLCVVEAMKVMNEIASETTGTIEEILPKNGDVVEEGDALFYIKPEESK